MAKDVVCGMEVDPENPGARAQYQGREYLFCSEMCRIKFEEDPERYLETPADEKE